MNNDALIAVVCAALDATRVRGWDAQSEDSAIRFSWHTVRFRVSSSLHCVEIRGNMEHHSLYADLMTRLLKATAARMELQAIADELRDNVQGLIR